MNGKWLFYDYVWKIRREWIRKTRERDREWEKRATRMSES